MSDTAHSSASIVPSVFASLAPMVGIIFLGFLAVGAPLPALSLYVHNDLGFSTTVVGWVIGVQSFVTVLTRHRAGAMSDLHGPRRAVLIGLPITALSGVLYLAAVAAPLAPGGKLAILVLGRLLQGVGESLFVTGTMSWGIGRAGAARTGLVMSWQGIAIFAAIGLGAPLGLGLEAGWGFGGVAILAIVAPLVACAITLSVSRLPGASAGAGTARVPFYQVLGLIWRPGLVLTLGTMPFAAMATFLALDYAAHGWSGAGLAVGAFGVGYVLVRLVGSHWPAAYGGARVAGVSMAIEAVGQILLWLAPSPVMALAGAGLTGIGFSLVFPAMGVVATNQVAPALRGRAVGGFIAFFDVAIGLTGPLLGLVAGQFGFAAVFLTGVGTTLAALVLLPSVGRMKAAG